MSLAPIEAPAAVRAISPVLESRLRVYEELLLKWQPKMNLVAPSTLQSIRTRHIEDSLQVSDLFPDATSWVDLGSGGGFPGLVTAMRIADTPGSIVHLVESDHRKCAFLREVSRETGAPAEIHRSRIEDVLENLPEVQAISARALAPLPVLYGMSEKRLEKGVIALFLKGQDVASELTQTPISSNILLRLVRSRTDADGRVVILGRRAHRLMGGVAQ